MLVDLASPCIEEIVYNAPTRLEHTDFGGAQMRLSAFVVVDIWAARVLVDSSRKGLLVAALAYAKSTYLDFCATICC